MLPLHEMVMSVHAIELNIERMEEKYGLERVGRGICHTARHTEAASKA